MEFIKSKLEGVHIIKNKILLDHRGSFFKVFNNEEFKKKKIEFQIEEVYFSVSSKDVIRGMHFQLPPHEHDKIVFVLQGEIEDVVLDLRKTKDTFQKYDSFNLKENAGEFLYIPKGLAHGFISLQDDTIVGYLVTSGYNPHYDTGIRFDSFGYDWKVFNPIISERDKSFTTLDKFKNPFA